MSNKIEFKDLIGLEGLEAIDKAIEKIDKIDQVFEKFAELIENRKSTIVKSMNAIDGSFESLATTMEKLDMTNEKHQKEVAKTAKKVEVQKEQYIGMSREVKELEKNLEAIRSEQNKLNTERNQSIKDQQQLIKLQSKLNSLESDEAKEIARLKVQISERNKEIKRTAMESEGLISVYQKEVKRLRDMKNEYKDAVLVYGENSKEVKKLKGEMIELDGRIKEIDANAGDFHRNVGNYPEMFEQIGGSAGQAVGGVKSLGASFKALMANPIVALIAGIVAGITFLFNAFKKTTGGAEKFEQALSAISSTFNTIISRVGKWLSGELSLRELLTETGDAISENVKTSVELVKARRQLEKTTADNIKREAELGETIAKLEAIRDNDSKSLKEREESARLLTEALVKQAQMRKDTIDEEVRIAQMNASKFEEGTEDRRLAEIELTKALATQADARAEIIRSQSDAERELQMIRLDRFEQELDLLLDIEDRKKQVNEREIKDERTTASQRMKLLRENVKMIDESYAKQIESFNKWFDIQVDGNEILQLSGEELFEYTNSLGLSERAVNRLREVVIEKISADRDNIDSINEVNKALELETNVTERFEERQKEWQKDRVKRFKEGNREIKELVKQRTRDMEEEQRQLFDQFLKTDEGRRYKFIESLDYFQEQFDRVAQNIKGGLINLTMFQNGQAESRIRKLEEEKERAIEASGESAEVRALIERRYDSRIEALERKQQERRRRIAIFEKGVAAAKSIINTASAVAEALPNIPKSIAVGILGALKTGAILATPIPQYAQGTDFHSGGLAVVGDGGRHEVVQKPDGSMSITPDKSTLVDLPRGSKVFDSIISASRALGSKNSDQLVHTPTMNTERLEAHLKAVVDAVVNKPEPSYDLVHGKIVKTVRKGNTIHKDWNSVNSY